jgi:aminobenzoyl-glutamate utilization protein B
MNNSMKIVITCFLIFLHSSLLAQLLDKPTLSREKEITIEFIDSIQADLFGISDSIWSFAEIGLEEYKSSKCLASYLEKNGFKIEWGQSGMPTAFIAEYGVGEPIIGIAGEYDALPGLSQKFSPVKEALIEGAPGHGCGHNIVGTGSLGAAMAVKNLMKKGLLKGTIRYYGTPDEENTAGKMYLTRDGYFDDLDVCMYMHPSNITKTYVNNSYAVFDFSIQFKGETAHAATAPWTGRSALDAVESFLNGINLLREHIQPSVRIHYVITKGGNIPNVIPDDTEVWLWIRDFEMENLLVLKERIENIAKGAALIAGVEQEVKLNIGLYNILSNKNGAKLLHSNIDFLGPVNYSKNETEFACMLQEAAGSEQTGIRNNALSFEESLINQEINTSDMGDVSWNVPVIFLNTAILPENIHLHTWGATACFGSSIGHRGMIYSSKALALTMIDLYQNQELLNDIKNEFEANKGSVIYKALIPDGPPPKLK